ncbi:MAG: hypothetical protein J1E16_03140 [Muribaculaceae bacterium]|nr:hypothetical protein [Muribaculaceae bacterium]
MIRIFDVIEIKGFIFGYPEWDLNNDGMEIKFLLVPDSTNGIPYLSNEMAMINVMVFKRDIIQEDIDKWIKGARISETGFLCDYEQENEGYIDKVRFVLIL